MKIIITIVITFLGFNLFAQNHFIYNPNLISKKIKNLIVVFDKANQIEDEYLYYGGIPSKTYPAFKLLKKKAKRKELIELTNHSNPIIRYYAFDALIEKRIKSDILFNIVKAHLKDTVTVKTQFGCIGGKTTIGDYMLSTYSNNYKFNGIKKAEIDSLLFWNKQNLINKRNYVFSKVKRNRKNYKRLKEILINEKNPNALLPLLSYKIKDDEKFIKEFISISPIYAFYALKLYPKERLVVNIKEFQKKSFNDFSNHTWIALYDAIQSYPKQIALELFLNVFKNEEDLKVKEKHAKFIYHSIKDNYSQYLLPVKFEIASYLSNMTIEYFNLLWDTDSIRTFKFIKEKFEKENHPYWNEKLINEIIDKIESLKGDSAITFINQGIKKGYSTTYYTLALRAKKYKNPETVKILINRFNNELGESEGDIYYRSEGILNYNSEIVYKKIENKVFQFMQNKEIGDFAGENIVKLALICNQARGIKTLLRYIKENQKNTEFLIISVSKLIVLNKPFINKRLVEIYYQSNKVYKDSDFGQDFNWILKKNNLKK